MSPVRADLQWLAGAMGTARDTQVNHERLTDRLDAEPPERIVGPIAGQIAEQTTFTKPEVDSQARPGTAGDT